MPLKKISRPRIWHDTFICWGQWLTGESLQLFRALWYIFSSPLFLSVCRQKIKWVISFSKSEEEKLKQQSYSGWRPTLCCQAPWLSFFAKKWNLSHQLGSKSTKSETSFKIFFKPVSTSPPFSLSKIPSGHYLRWWRSVLSVELVHKRGAITSSYCEDLARRSPHLVIQIYDHTYFRKQLGIATFKISEPPER